MKSVLCDINFFLDLFLRREPYFQAACSLFSKIERGEVRGYISALSFPILFYLLSKEISRDQAIQVLEKLRIVFEVAPVDDRVIDLALSSGFKDFEDAVQYYSGLQVGVDCIITRNKKDLAPAKIPVLSPEAFLVK